MTNPPAAHPDPAEVAAFYDRFHERLLRDYVRGNRRAEAAVDFAARQVRPGTRSILDVGCGAGVSTDRLARAAPRATVTGVDIGPENVRAARRLFAGPRVSFAVSDLTAPPAGGPWDLVVLLDVYEHLPAADRGRHHAVLADCLAADATLALTVPSPAFQAYLRERKPDALQVIDETVTAADLDRLAGDVGGVLAAYRLVSVWGRFDYAHAVVRRGGAGPAASDTPPTEGVVDALRTPSLVTRVRGRIDRVRRRRRLERRLGRARS